MSFLLREQQNPLLGGAGFYSSMFVVLKCTGTSNPYST